MKWYTYWDNSHQHHGGLLLLVRATSLADADAEFLASHGYDPKTKNTVGVTITDDPQTERLERWFSL